MTLHAREWTRRSARVIKPGGCSLRRSKPKGPISGCEETCWAFEACVSLTQDERDFEERAEKILEDMRRELEILDSLDVGGA